MKFAVIDGVSGRKGAPRNSICDLDPSGQYTSNFIVVDRARLVEFSKRG